MRKTRFSEEQSHYLAVLAKAQELQLEVEAPFTITARCEPPKPRYS